MTAQQRPVPASGRRAAPVRRIALASALATGAMLAAGSAQAVVSAPGTTGFGGSMTDIGYGSAGNIFQLDPMLFVLGLGSADNALTVANRNAALQYSFSVSGQGSGLMTIEYLVRNTSAVESFNQLRFVAYANPDGVPEDAPNGLRDVLSETWGAEAAGDPVRREGRRFIDPVTGINVGFGLNGNLSEGPPALDALCTALAGCDATVGLQWNATTLAPGETFRVRLGLSDNGQSLSGRFLSISAVDDPGTVLTFSGQSAIVPVPEPGAAGMLAAGLAALGWLARRRQRAAA